MALLHDVRALEAAAHAAAFVLSPPWAAVDPAAPALAGRAYQLTHMSLPQGALSAPRPRADVRVELVRDEAALNSFTQVQAAGFADEGDYDTLFDWMLDKNARAFPLRDQHYYLLRLDGAPASVLLTVDTSEAVGVYAVATPSPLRKRGLSSHLLAQVCANAPTSKQICLQVMRGSDAERLYAKLGFQERFVVDVCASALFP
jgi:hypothetical protein